MKLSKTVRNVASSMFMMASCTAVYAGTMGNASMPARMYVGVFGGGGATQNFGMAQYGTAFFLEADGGPLGVNAFGTASSESFGFVGGQAGYQWAEIPLNLFSMASIAPATEIEGYAIGNRNFTGHDINNDTTRLPEHDFLVNYPTDTGVFLVNAVANFNCDMSMPFKLRPYVGAGIGAARLSISNATSIQTSPAEVFNHYNANTNSADTAFAGQVKAGLTVALTQNIDIFGEYRWLYLSSTEYMLGSTVYPTHAATSSWVARFGSQSNNMGAAGIRYSI